MGGYHTCQLDFSTSLVGFSSLAILCFLRPRGVQKLPCVGHRHTLLKLSQCSWALSAGKTIPPQGGRGPPVLTVYFPSLAS